jgi:hypothetical protein
MSNLHSINITAKMTTNLNVTSVTVKTRNIDVVIDINPPGQMAIYAELCPEYAYVLYEYLRVTLFGSDPNAKFKPKP